MNEPRDVFESKILFTFENDDLFVRSGYRFRITTLLGLKKHIVLFERGNHE